MEIVSRTGQDMGQGGTVKEEQNCWVGQSFQEREWCMFLVAREQGEGSAECDDGRALLSLCLGLRMGSSLDIIYHYLAYLAYLLSR